MTPAAARGGARRARARQVLAGAAVAAAAAAAVLVVLGLRQFVSYDSFWHVFVARQGTPAAFAREIRENAHPPLYYVFLKGAIALLGDSLLAYRSVSIVSIGLATVLLARTALRLTGNPPLAVAAAAAFGLSTSALEIGLEVRQYALCLVWMLAALGAYLDWLGAGSGGAPARVRLRLAGFLSAGLLTHYSAYFLLGAFLAIPPILFVADRRRRARLKLELLRRGSAAAATFGVPLAIALAAYRSHAGTWEHGLNHLKGFMFAPGPESASAFLARTTGSLLSLFLPGPRGLVLATALLAAALFAGFALRWSRRFARGRLAFAPLLMAALMLLANAAGGIAGRYPYGGELRHEIFLFPFLVLALFVAVEGFRRSLPGRWSSPVLWAGAAWMLVAANAGHALVAFPRVAEPLFEAQMNRFRALAGEPPAVQADQFNFIGFFGLHHEWEWRLRWEKAGPGMWQVWEVSRGDRRFMVCRNREWLLDFSQPELYASVRECLERSGADRVAVFRPQQGGSPPAWRIEDTPSLARELGARAGVAPEALLADGDGVYASFVRRGRAGRISVLEAASGADRGAAR